MDIETGESPSYEEIMERFGDEVSMDEAVRQTAHYQRQYPDLTAIGSILSSEEVYGAEDVRRTSQALDFVADPETIRDMNEEHDETWSYGGNYVFAIDERDSEWMVAVIPCNEEVFTDEEFEPFNVDSYSVMEPNQVKTSQGEISAVSPELGITSKLRRYMMQKENRGSFKRSDLVDIVNIMAESYERDDFDYKGLEWLMNQQVGRIPEEDILHDTAESLVENGADNHLDDENIEAGFRELKGILE